MRHYMFDPELSMRTKGVMAFLEYVQGDDEWTIEYIAAYSADSKDGVRKSMKELENRGYLTRERERKNGRLANVKYTLYPQKEE